LVPTSKYSFPGNFVVDSITNNPAKEDRTPIIIKNNKGLVEKFDYIMSPAC
jgi:hypothetical protein